MKNLLPIYSLFLFTLIICALAIGKAFATKSAILLSPALSGHIKANVQQTTSPAVVHFVAAVNDNIHNAAVADADSIDFDVEVVQPRKFLLSFTKKREETFFIKIYDVIGNLIHHEVVSKKGKFRKHYDLSKYKTELYVIEVSSGKKAKIKRLFLG